MDRELPFDINQEKARQVVSSIILEIETSGSPDLLKDKWNQAKDKTNLPIYTYAQTLFEFGHDEQTIKSLVGLVRDLDIDVSDPHTSSSELSVITGILSNELIGVDMTPHRRDLDKVRMNPVSVTSQEFLSPAPPEIVYLDDERAQYHELSKLKAWQRELIFSDKDYQKISRQLLEQNNQALEAVVRGRLQKYWAENGIPEDSKATVYFRDHKTYAGDIDFYYWGPESEKCTIELSRYLMSLGYKVDHRSNILIEELIKNREVVENGYLSAYLQMYFYMGKTIEFNGDSFQSHYASDVVPIARPELYWSTSHKSLSFAIGIVGGVYSQDMSEYPGLKDYPFRLLSATLMGLAYKYDVPFTRNYEDLFDTLSGRLSEDEVTVLRSSFYYLNQARNIYQLVSERRWEMMTPAIKNEVNKALLRQSALRIEDAMALLAGKIKAVAGTHFGEPNSEGVLDLNKSKEQAEAFVARAYQKVGERYKQIARL